VLMAAVLLAGAAYFAWRAREVELPARGRAATGSV
jgi:hypothetical protein